MNRLLITPWDIKAVGDDGIFEGLAATFGNVDLHGDRIERGAFAGATASRVKLLWQHDTRAPIGVWESIEETSDGLEAKGRLLLEVQQAREAHALMKAGALDGLSIGYSIKEGGADVDSTTRVRVLKKLELHEISPVTFPANPKARIHRVKAADITDEREFEQYLRDAGFSKAFAVAVSSRGFAAASRRDAEGEADELVASIRRGIQTLTQ